VRNLKLLLQREPAALGSLVASIMPVLVLLGVVRIDEAGIAAIVVAVNAAVGFATRLVVSPTAAPASPSPLPLRPAERLAP
jgi:mRNA-degrading endonuclease toxin of MazEF toxin-antitoxin module